MIRCETECEAIEWDSFWVAYTFANPVLAAAPSGVPMIAVIGAAAGAVILGLLAFVVWRRSTRLRRCRRCS